MPRTTKKKTAAAKTSQPIPLWAKQDPQELTYTLAYNHFFFDQNAEREAWIDLTREEYIALKDHLAKLRGYNVPEVE